VLPLPHTSSFFFRCTAIRVSKHPFFLNSRYPPPPKDARTRFLPIDLFLNCWKPSLGAPCRSHGLHSYKQAALFIVSMGFFSWSILAVTGLVLDLRVMLRRAVEASFQDFSGVVIPWFFVVLGLLPEAALSESSDSTKGHVFLPFPDAIPRQHFPPRGRFVFSPFSPLQSGVLF